MSESTEIINAVASTVSAMAAVVATVGVWYARNQLKTSREIAQLQFEDALGKEYRELANRMKPKVLLGSELSDPEYEEAFDEMFHYVDLSNEQVSLRQRGRISLEVWVNWSAGIRSNLELPAFKRAWSEIKLKSSSFQELRRFETDGVGCDPAIWK
jgi:hypothetical protein